MSNDSLRANIVLERDTAGRAGADRMALLRAIGERGSISAAARDVGLSYKAAWDAVQVLNNLFDQPLVARSAGGRDGGASHVTQAGEAVLAAFAAAETDMAAAIARLREDMAGHLAGAAEGLFWGMKMKISARNVLAGTVTSITPGPVNSEVTLRVAEDIEIVATITSASVDDLRLAAGVSALAIIKASFVILLPGDQPLRTSARNQLAGTVVRREDGAVSSEVTIELSTGKTLTATLTLESATDLDLRPGMPAFALIKASHVILAVG